MCCKCKHEVIKKAKGMYVVVHGDYTYETTYGEPLDAMENCRIIEAEFFHDFHWEDRERQREQDEFDKELRERGY